MISAQPLLSFPATAAANPEPGDDGLVGFILGLVERLGGPGAGLAVALENLFPPIPSEVILPLAGFAASQGRMSLVGAIFWTTLGSVVGALALYAIGAMLGRDRMRAIAAKLPLIKLEDVDRTEAWFIKHGVKAVFFGRMIPVFRSLISIPAGVERMPVTTFLLYTTLGSLIWNTVFVMAGYLLGENWHVVEDYAGNFQKVVILICVVAAAWFVVSRVRRALAARRASAEGLDPSATSVHPAGEDPGFGHLAAPQDPAGLRGPADLQGSAGFGGASGPQEPAGFGHPATSGDNAASGHPAPFGTVDGTLDAAGPGGRPPHATGDYRGTVYRAGSWQDDPER